jgi:hypothetical protein
MRLSTHWSNPLGQLFFSASLEQASGAGMTYCHFFNGLVSDFGRDLGIPKRA